MRHGLARKRHHLDHLRQLPGAVALLFGDHLVTMGVHLKRWGAMQHQLDPLGEVRWLLVVGL